MPKLKKTLQLNIDHNDICKQIKIDSQGNFCLNDMAKFFPQKSIKAWKKNKATQELLRITSDFLNGANSTHLKVLSTKKGRHNSGTYAHEIIALDFAMWLDPMFKLKVILSYTQGKEDLQGWNIERTLSAKANKLQCEAIARAEKDPQSHHFACEARMINEIVFGYHERDIRDKATTEQLSLIYKLMNFNAGYIEQGLSFEKRKALLQKIS